MEMDNVTSDQDVSKTPAVNRKPYQAPKLWRLGDIQEVVQDKTSAGYDGCCSQS